MHASEIGYAILTGTPTWIALAIWVAMQIGIVSANVICDTIRIANPVPIGALSKTLIATAIARERSRRSHAVVTHPFRSS